MKKGKSNHRAKLEHIMGVLDQITDTLNTVMTTTDLPDTPRDEIITTIEAFGKIVKVANILAIDLESVHSDISNWFSSVEIKYSTAPKMYDMEKRISFLSDAIKSLHDITDIDIPNANDLPGKAPQETEDYENFLNDLSWSLDDAVVQTESAITDLRMVNMS